MIRMARLSRLEIKERKKKRGREKKRKKRDSDWVPQTFWTVWKMVTRHFQVNLLKTHAFISHIRNLLWLYLCIFISKISSCGEFLKMSTLTILFLPFLWVSLQPNVIVPTSHKILVTTNGWGFKILFWLSDVWVTEKGIHREDQPVPQKETLEQLQLECFATFGSNFTVISRIWDKPRIILIKQSDHKMEDGW